VRSPFYEYAKSKQMNEKDAHELLDDMGMKYNLLDDMEFVLHKDTESKEARAYTRYADNNAGDKDRHILTFPRGKPYKRIN
jgi:hypothetical protein